MTIYTNFLVEYINHLKVFLKKIAFCNVNFSNLENFLQKKQKTGRNRECIRIFRAFGGTDFENFSGCEFDGFNFVQ